MIFYNLLCDRLPFDVEHKSWQAIEYMVGQSEPRPLNTFDGPHIVKDLEAISAAALRRDPAERYSSVEHFAEDIRRFQNHRPVRARRGE